MIKLINTIEVSPLKYSKEEYELPDASDYPDADDWYRKWEEVISKLDLGFHTIKKDSYLVDIETIDEENLQMILETDLQEIDLEKFEDEVPAFAGGIVLTQNDKILIVPSCCGNIGNIEEWQRILDNKTSDWSDLWIGHPWVFYRKQNGKVQFSDYSDLNLKEFTDIKVIFEVDESELKNELDKMKKHQIKFKHRITEILKKINVENSERISELMTGLGTLH
ncbi:hypothetical protein [Chryseobacterium luquanense]|uniref:Uncharacterized protein n=1 Tax=Chryseobacterium luquanense TaxID=2983766 RepID=A0ABT3Y0Y9_9FLAO|nr:hypothetical protein [Chryseobacterium luquanense]MCX8531803.1 hypothetical protein [Chryseobacterium luquanense]